MLLSVDRHLQVYVIHSCFRQFYSLEQSPASSVNGGVPQGQYFVPFCFSYTPLTCRRLLENMDCFRISMLTSDDTQIYRSCRPTDADQLQSRVLACVDEVASWMEPKRLQLNTGKMATGLMNTVAAARVWNSLPNHVISASSVSVFRKCLKAVLFCRLTTDC